jgi:peptidyl-prolyl isomerase G (cyclophilin G)
MSYTFLDVKIGQPPSSRIIIELYEKDAPETCRFFKLLLNHPNGYKGTRFHRVIEDFMIQGGDVDLEKYDSIGRAPDMLENADHPVDKAGLVFLARTTAAENNSQFFVNLVPAEHLQGVHSIFGKVVKGFEVVEKIGQVEVDDSDNPVTGSEVVIVSCGELQPRKPRPSSPPRSASPPSKPLRDSNGKSKERSRSTHKDSDRHRRRSRSPSHRHAEHRHRRNSHHDNDDDDRRHHHRRRRKSPVKQDVVDKAEHHRRNRSHSPERKESSSRHESGNGHNQSRDKIPTGPRGYQPRQRYQAESNYGRLGYDVSYDEDVRDDEYRLREIERGREGERGREEPTVTFKGRGVMKYRERYQ